MNNRTTEKSPTSRSMADALGTCAGRNGQPNRLLRRGPCIVFKTSVSPRHGKTNRAKVQRVSPELNGKTASAHRGGRRKACCPFLSSFCGFGLRNFGNRLRDSLWLVFQRQVRLRHNSNAIPFSVYYGNPTKLVFLHGAFAFLHVLKKQRASNLAI